MPTVHKRCGMRQVMGVSTQQCCGRVQEAAASKAARRHDKARALATSLAQCSEALQLQVGPHA